MLGTVGLRHHSRQGYPTETVASFLRAFAPDVVLVDVPPAAFERVLTLAPDDPWLRSRPELREAVLPLAAELSYDVVPVSGFEDQARTDWAAYWSEHPDGPDSADWRRAVGAYHFGWGEVDDEDFALYVNGPDFARQKRWVRQALSAAAEEQLGAAGVYALEGAHFDRVRAAIEAHPGQRIALVFGAGHRWYLTSRVAELEGVTLLDARAFLAPPEAE